MYHKYLIDVFQILTMFGLIICRLSKCCVKVGSNSTSRLNIYSKHQLSREHQDYQKIQMGFIIRFLRVPLLPLPTLGKIKCRGEFYNIPGFYIF